MPEIIQPEEEQLLTKRLLFFLNHIRSGKDLEGAETILGNSDAHYLDGLASHILQVRTQLPTRRFTEISQLDHLVGISPGSLKNLQEFFLYPAAELFKQDMFERVLLSNFTLLYQRISFDEDSLFQAVIDDATTLTEVVSSNLFLNSYGILKEVEIRRQIRRSFVDAYPNGHLASFAFALWFYSFDLDNWFSFDQVRECTERYLDVHRLSSDRQSLYFLRGFDNRLLIQGGRTIPHLPLVVNYEEKSLSIWTCSLQD